jgi:hypothetical protein
MNRHKAGPLTAGLLRAGALAVLTALAGCTHNERVRGQRGEDGEHERYPLKTVGDVSSFGNADPIPVSGIGLVEGLDGTGSPAPPGGYRQALEHELRKQRMPNVSEVLNSSDYSLVLVTAVVPPGARPKDPLDVEITLPPGSRTTSLRGGRLRRCVLYNYEYLSNLSPKYANSSASLKGSPIARAEGQLVVGFGGDEAARSRTARIWGGGTCLVPRPFHIYLNADQSFARVAANVAGRINLAFQGNVSGPGTEVASAKSGSVVLLTMPPQYKHNPQRYLRVVRMIPLEDGVASKPGEPKRLPYPTQLQQDLLDPGRSVVAALRLEALGAPSVPALRQGLQSPHPLVRFCSAEALAYLGSPSCGDELARVVRQQPYLRLYALTALASLDESVCHERLQDLLGEDLDDETRYGAFRALRALDEHDDDVKGQLLSGSFWLHRVAPGTKPLIHVSMARRAEVVLFGDKQTLIPPFSLLAGEYTVTAAADDQRCTISHVPLDGGEAGVSRTRSSLELAEVLKVLAKQGATYPEVLELIRQADEGRALSCRLRHDALPQAVTVQQLAQVGREEADRLKNPAAPRPTNAVEIVKTDNLDLGATPALYQTAGSRGPATLDDDARALQHDRSGADAKKTAERR